MGGGTYSIDRRDIRSATLGYKSKTADEIFKNKNIDNGMNPKGIKIRESRDSEEHPNSFSIILGLDVTGSMGKVPHFLVQEGLPKIMNDIIKNGIADPQILFLGIGDHYIDDAPLQVGQFESSDDLLDKWLTDIYLEGGGGGNGGESYMLAHYFAGYHTSIDCLEKRDKRGVLITIGDEPIHEYVEGQAISDIMGKKTGYKDKYTSADLIETASKLYEIHHINVAETNVGRRPETAGVWRELLGDNLHMAKNREQVANVVSDIVVKVGSVGNEEPLRQTLSDAAGSM